MRLTFTFQVFVLKKTRAHIKGEEDRENLCSYWASGGIFLGLNLATNLFIPHSYTMPLNINIRKLFSPLNPTCLLHLSPESSCPNPSDRANSLIYQGASEAGLNSLNIHFSHTSSLLSIPASFPSQGMSSCFKASLLSFNDSISSTFMTMLMGLYHPIISFPSRFHEWSKTTNTLMLEKNTITRTLYNDKRVNQPRWHNN